jgi:hypothetical protein
MSRGHRLFAALLTAAALQLDLSLPGVSGLALARDAAGPEPVPDAPLLLDPPEGRAVVRVSELGDRPLLLVPIFTRCRGVCGLMVERLGKAWGEAGPEGVQARVLLVSFDPEDTREDLRRFRALHRIPASWKLAVLEREEGLRFFGSLGFRWMSLEGRQFDHAGKLFVLTQARRIAAVLGPEQLTSERLRTEVEAAVHGPSLAHRIGTHWIGFFGVGLVLLGLVASVCWDRLRTGRVLTARPEARS